jgi:hypothetical protein
LNLLSDQSDFSFYMATTRLTPGLAYPGSSQRHGKSSQYFSNISAFGEIESVQQHQQIQAIPLDQDIQHLDLSFVIWIYLKLELRHSKADSDPVFLESPLSHHAKQTSSAQAVMFRSSISLPNHSQQPE